MKIARMTGLCSIIAFVGIVGGAVARNLMRWKRLCGLKLATAAGTDILQA
jgi:hypothetical protein